MQYTYALYNAKVGIDKFKNKMKTENPWDYTDYKSWKELTSPWRPSKEDVKNYKKLIDRTNPEKILLLGSTPEIRDLLYLLNKKITLVDSSISMIQQMEKLIKKNNSKEKWLIDNWQKVNIPKDSLDLITGDLVLRLIPYKKQKPFLRKINYLLKKGGVFVTRVHYVNEELQFVKPEKILRDMLRLYKRKKISLKETRGSIILRLYDKFTDFDRHLINEDQLYSFLESFVKKTSPENKKIIRETLDIWSKGSFSYTQLRKEKVEKKLKEYFNLSGHLTANDYYDSQSHPIYLLKKR